MTREQAEKQAIKELSQDICQEITGSPDGNEDGQRQFIEELIKEWIDSLCRKGLLREPGDVQLDPDQQHTVRPDKYCKEECKYFPRPPHDVDKFYHHEAQPPKE